MFYYYADDADIHEEKHAVNDTCGNISGGVITEITTNALCTLRVWHKWTEQELHLERWHPSAESNLHLYYQFIESPIKQHINLIQNSHVDNDNDNKMSEWKFIRVEDAASGITLFCIVWDVVKCRRRSRRSIRLQLTAAGSHEWCNPVFIHVVGIAVAINKYKLYP